MVVPADSKERYLSRGHLFVVADGMGAHAAGELASRIAAEQIPLYYLRKSSGDAREALREAVQQANHDIHQRGQQNHEFHNMGTTASSLAILPAGAIVAHVGDSRVYRLRDDRLEQLTFDHSLVWEMEAAGQFKSDSQLCGSIPKNIITRSLGPSPTVAVDIEGPFPVRSGDRFLLCSDGLTGQIDDAEIGPLLSALPPAQAARMLVDLANLRGGPDNTTVVVVEVGEQEQNADGGEGAGYRALGDPSLPRPMLLAASVCLLAAILLGISGNIGPMVVALILGAIAGGVAAFQYRQRRGLIIDNGDDAQPRRAGPYRSCAAKPTAELLAKLDQIIEALRNAASERRWNIDWRRVDALIVDDQRFRRQGRFAEAMKLQADAIVETMGQLRNQQRGGPL